MFNRILDAINNALSHDTDEYTERQARIDAQLELGNKLFDECWNDPALRPHMIPVVSKNKGNYHD